MPLHTNLASTDHFVLIHRRIHTTPELGFAETQTVALVAQESDTYEIGSNEKCRWH
jgi:metal-dependent amidase/aminoacylase/carboxypeptidase family protein